MEAEKGKRSGKKVWQWVGFFFIICGLVLLGYAAYEKLMVFYHQQQLKKAYKDTFYEIPEGPDTFDHVVITERQPMRLIIPKINVDLIVQIGDVFDMNLLDKGPVHFQMSDLPSTESGNVAIAAHRGSRWGFFTDLDQLKEGDEITQTIETSNNRELLFFTDKGTVYKSRVSDFPDSKASVIGDYVASNLGFEEGENAIYMVVTSDYSGYMVFLFENGKIAKVELSAYQTKTNRRKLINAYSTNSPVVAIFHIQKDEEILLTSSSGRMLLVHTGAFSPKATRNTIGVQAITLRSKHRLMKAELYREGMLARPDRYRTKTLPAAGSLPAPEDLGEQLTLE